jgi:hypothetical protein
MKEKQSSRKAWRMAAIFGKNTRFHMEKYRICQKFNNNDNNINDDNNEYARIKMDFIVLKF